MTRYLHTMHRITVPQKMDAAEVPIEEKRTRAAVADGACDGLASFTAPRVSHRRPSLSVWPRDARKLPILAISPIGCPKTCVAGLDISPASHVLHRPCRVVAGRSRSRPVRSSTKSLLQPVIPGGGRRWRLSPYRPVTPEVAGSSPVAPVLDVPARCNEPKRPLARPLSLDGQ